MRASLRSGVAICLATSLLLVWGALSAGCTVHSGAPDGEGGIDGSLDAALDALLARDVPSFSDAERPDAGMPDGGPGRECTDEACSNGLDDDCDGVVDDGCGCLPGEVLPCFRGAAPERSVGICADGRMTCGGLPGDEFGTWGPCMDDVIASAEACDEGRLDEDCDGATDEDCECVDGDPPTSCGLALGRCVPGAQRCEGGTLTACEGAVGPATETCDGSDEDCDGRTDEGLTTVCGTDEGACRPGLSRCMLGVWGACEGGAAPTDETCDGVDEDCDGAIDDMVSRLCGTDAGRCVAGTERCTAGVFGACTGRIDPVAETCNAQDDDCDGLTDESLSRVCGTDVGACASGTETCEDGGYGLCVGSRGPVTEICNALDDDCDGMEDEGCSCVDGATRACGTDVGRCVAGTSRCATGAWGACSGSVEAIAEACNIMDDDCDGRTDEAFTLGGVCNVGLGTCARSGTLVCTTDGLGSTCSVSPGSPSTEVCNGQDDDCDGLTDDGNPGGGGACDGADADRCAEGTVSCVSGSLVCSDTTGDNLELCNSRDDDCDTRLDEGFALGGSCSVGVGVCIRSGTVICRVDGTATQCSATPGSPGVEVCNGLDDDCDGTADDGDPGGGGMCDGTDGDLCLEGTLRCMSGSLACSDVTGTTTEICNGIDDDCDGSLDEGCDCLPGQVRSCGTDVGACSAGTETCDGTGHWGACLGSIGPVPETCNGIDDDCDGPIDDGGVCVPPIVACPGGQSTTTGTVLMLAGSGSDPDGGAVGFSWTVTARPAGSTAMPMPANSATTSFTPDAAGSYTLELCVTDDEGQRTCCTSTITAALSCTPPTAPALSACGVSWDRRPIVEFAPLPAGIVYTLFQDGSMTPYGTVSAVGQNYFRPASALAAGGPPPTGTSTSITLRACRDTDPTCCGTSAPVSVRLIEACTTPIAPTASNIVFSEYVIDGDGACPGASCEAGEAIEITNLSNCPIALAGNHFSACNGTCSSGSERWMDFTAADVIPPRGVYVAIRERALSMCSYPNFGPDDPSLFGLRVSALAMQGMSLSSGWFSNAGGALSQLRVATGAYVSPSTGATLDLVSPYLTGAAACSAIGYNAVNACGELLATDTPTTVLTPNQLGRLWHPCDAVVSPVPASCR